MRPKSGDKHKYHHRLNVKVCGEIEDKLQRFLPEQEGVEGKARYLLSVMAEVALSEERFRLAPKSCSAGRMHMLRVPEETYLAVRRYAEAGGLDLTKQATNLLVAGLELLKKSSSAKLPLGKEELKRRIRCALDKRSRSENIRQGFSLIWQALKWR